MQTGHTTGREVEAHQLFDIEARIERARADLETATWRYDDARSAALEAKQRLELAETPLAQIESCEAERRMRAFDTARHSAHVALVDLEAIRDGLLSKLVS